MRILKHTRPVSSGNAGISLVELLVALAVLAILFGFLAAFFARQSKATAQSQAHNELQVKVRSVGEVLLQDLELVGTRSFVTGSGSNSTIARPFISQCPAGNPASCIQYDSTTEETTMYYLTSLTQSTPCHRVAYWLDSSSKVLYRFDQAVATSSDGTLCTMPTPYTVPPTNQDFAIASGITKLQIDYTCSTGTPTDTTTSPPTAVPQNPSKCPVDPDTGVRGYVTGAKVIVDGQTSYHGKTITGQFEAKAPTPNLGAQ